MEKVNKIIEQLQRLKEILNHPNNKAILQQAINLINSFIGDDKREWSLGIPKEDGIYHCYDFNNDEFDILEIYTDEETNERCATILRDAPYTSLYELNLKYCIWHGPIKSELDENMKILIRNYDEEITKLNQYLHFHAIDSYELKGNQIFIVKNKKDCEDFSYILEQPFVFINGEQYKIASVEAFSSKPPYIEGEAISLTIAPVAQG